MIKLGSFLGAMFAAALLLCAFPLPTGGQDKTAPSNPPPNAPSNVVIEDQFVKLQAAFLKLQADFLKTKQELEQKIDTINRRLDSIDQLLSVRGGTGGDSSVLPPAPGAVSALSDGRSDYSDLQSCCRHVNYHVPCCGYVYHREPCCRDAYHRVRHVYHPRRIYHPQPCCRYASRELD
jgi:hypothetical protein